MKFGSLVECIVSCTGFRYVNGIPTKLMPSINKGEILTIETLIPSDSLGTVGIAFSEHDPVFHPVNKKQCGSPIRNFREIQPPLSIDIESLTEQPVEHA